MIVDPRLPDPALASRRVYGDLRPSVNIPGRCSVTTTSERQARGWIDAINGQAKLADNTGVS